MPQMLKPQAKWLWGLVGVQDTYKGRQQKAVLLSEVFESQSEAWEAATAYLNASGRHTAALKGLHVVRVELATYERVPRHASPSRMKDKPMLQLHG